ncbi:MAG: 1,6-anhydro-N-acetylmuramyl-L-alanine amidase AmpD, partial [Casimicrobiaceae bacterium]
MMTGRSGRSSTRRLAIDDGGYANLARQIRSPNHDARPAGTPVTLVVIHGISVPTGVFVGDGVERLFTNRLDPVSDPHYSTIAHLRVSAHFLIRRDGGLVQFVSCDDRAWHAGASSWQGRERCNDFSIGIELEGADDVPYVPPQYTMLARLLKALARRYPLEHVVG